jgi:hypothetical protein
MLHAAHITRLQDEATLRWHEPSHPELPAANPFDALVVAQHRANFDLWHHEDAARDILSSDHDIVGHKHAIDTLNQQRNDLAEQLDLALLAAVTVQSEAAPLHSETPGMMIDRLSILALKRFHTAEETVRRNASVAHHERNQARLAVIDAQRSDLAACLDGLWNDILKGHRRFKLYRQMKMYNDPTLNPVLYNQLQPVADDLKPSDS